MIHPDKIGVEAKKKEDENYKFRSYLKGHADEEEFVQIITILRPVFMKQQISWKDF